jgi:probable HAF family extracellular repeat protein
MNFTNTYMVLLLILFPLTIYAQTKYKVIDLGVFATPSSINDTGQVVFNDGVQGTNVIWQNGTLTSIGTLGNGAVYAFSINDSGKVVGEYEEMNSQAFISHNGNMTALNVLSNIEESSAFGINNSGTIVGAATADTGGIRAVRWVNGNMQYLGYNNLSSFNGTANDINSNGQIAGTYDNQNFQRRGFFWQNGNLTEIGTLGGNISRAYKINNLTQIIGETRNANGDLRAFLWENGSLTEIISPEAQFSVAWDINDSTQIVGFQWINSTRTAFLWENGDIYNLNDHIDPASGWELEDAMAINNLGYIVGKGRLNGQFKSFLLVPKKYPVLIVPGIAGTYASNLLFDLSWLIQRGLQPDQYQVDPLGKVYDDLIKTLENAGYKKDTTLFVVNYDWRLPPGPIDNNIDGKIDGLTGVSITDNQFNYGVDYLGWYTKKASDVWRGMYDEDLDSIDVISHSTGGLVTRTYIQSNAYGDIYDAGNDYKLPKIRNFVMIGVPNRGASKAWNPIRDNWIADPVYRYVLSKILNRAYQKVLFGVTITGPDYNISSSTILDSLGNPSKTKFISQYVPTIRGLLATYDFVDFGNGLTNVNDDPGQRNNFLLDLNDGLDLNSSADANKFLDSAKVSVIYGTGNSTKFKVEQRSDFELLATQSFTDELPRPVFSGTIWFKDVVESNNGDGTVPTTSSAGQFQNDSRANLISFSSGDHTGLVSKREVQEEILNLLDVNYENDDISTGTTITISDVPTILNVISDPVELIITDGQGNRLGYTNLTGAITEIPNSIWTGDTDGMGYVFGTVSEPVILELTGLGEDYYVMADKENASPKINIPDHQSFKPSSTAVRVFYFHLDLNK